ncbi:MAG: hypothetical protein ACK55I_21930 [bacterium]
MTDSIITTLVSGLGLRDPGYQGPANSAGLVRVLEDRPLERPAGGLVESLPQVVAAGVAVGVAAALVHDTPLSCAALDRG